jgi:type I restriction enzyme S subunit
VNNHAHILRAAVSNKYLCYYLNQIDYSAHVSGTTRLKLTQAALRQIPVNFAPEAEQHRIVAKVEELFSELDKGVDSMTTARAQLKAYRQAVLKHAFEGKLTVNWRSSRGSDSTASAWQTLPVEALLSAPLCNGRSVKDRVGGFPVLRLTALKHGQIDLTEHKDGDWEREAALPFLVTTGDFLVARGNGSKQLVGIGGLVGEVTQEVAFPDTMIRLRLDTSQVDPKYFALCWNSRILRQQIERDARTTAGIYKINQNHVSGFMVPVPQPDEQRVIVSQLETLLSEVDSALYQVEEDLIRSDLLKQSVLRRAFSGRLVAENQSDESTSVLLERIKAQRKGDYNRRKKDNGEKEAA